jgi:hypothetical protein
MLYLSGESVNRMKAVQKTEQAASLSDHCRQSTVFELTKQKESNAAEMLRYASIS